MNRRTVLAATFVLAAAAAGCQTLGFSTPTAIPSYQGPAQLTPGGASNPVGSVAPAATPSAAPVATPAKS